MRRYAAIHCRDKKEVANASDRKDRIHATPWSHAQLPRPPLRPRHVRPYVRCVNAAFRAAETSGAREAPLLVLADERAAKLAWTRSRAALTKRLHSERRIAPG